MFDRKLLGVGADPEVFFITKEGTGVSAEGLIPGSKDNPSPMEGLPEGFCIQVDNVSAEYNIPPAKTAEEFDRSIMLALRYVAKQARKNKVKVAIKDVMYFDKASLNTPHALLMGCESDYNIWTREINPRPVAPEDWRTAAGHVHASWNNPSEKTAIVVGRMMDLFLGVPSILVTEPSLRRQLYGRSGAWRFKPYGGEYRTLSNFWIGERAYRRNVFHFVAQGFNRLQQQQDFFIEQMEEFGPEIQHTINTHDVDSALYLIEKFDLPRFAKLGEKNANL